MSKEVIKKLEDKRAKLVKKLWWHYEQERVIKQQIHQTDGKLNEEHKKP